MANGFGRSSSRHNLNSITARKLIVADSIQSTPIEYSGKCKTCGDTCASTVDECLACAMGTTPQHPTVKQLIEMTETAANDLLNNPLVSRKHSEIRIMISDLKQYPSARHAEVVIKNLYQIAKRGIR